MPYLRLALTALDEETWHVEGAAVRVDASVLHGRSLVEASAGTYEFPWRPAGWPRDDVAATVVAWVRDEPARSLAGLLRADATVDVIALAAGRIECSWTDRDEDGTLL